jgi:hypothetical protein
MDMCITTKIIKVHVHNVGYVIIKKPIDAYTINVWKNMYIAYHHMGATNIKPTHICDSNMTTKVKSQDLEKDKNRHLKWRWRIV